MKRSRIARVLDGLPLPSWPVILWLAVALRLAVGIGWWVVADTATNPLIGDSYLYAGTDGYLQLAHTWLHTGEWAFAPGESAVFHRPPTTVWLMALTTAWNPQFWFVNWLIVSVLLSIASLFVLRRIAQELALSDHWTRLLLLAFALHPMLVASVRATSFIQPGMLILLLVMATALHARRQPGIPQLILLGVTLAGAALTHGTFLLLVIIVPVWLFIKTLRIRTVVLPMVVTMLSIAPWSMRNSLEADRFIPVVNGAGTQFWIARGIASDDDQLIQRVYTAEAADSLRLRYYGAADPKDDAILYDAATANAGDYIGQYAEGLYRFWVPVNAVYPAKKYADSLLVLPIALLWLWLTMRHLRRLSLLSIISLMLWGVFAVFYPSSSYYLLVLPLLLLEIARVCGYTNTASASTNSITADSMAAEL